MYVGDWIRCDLMDMIVLLLPSEMMCLSITWLREAKVEQDQLGMVASTVLVIVKYSVWMYLVLCVVFLTM